jgi:hypothetical protein
VLASKDAKTAAQSEARDPDGRPAAGGDGETVLIQCIVQITQARPGTNSRHVAGDRHRAHRTDVDDNPFRRGVPWEAVSPAPDRRAQPRAPSEANRLGDIFRGLATDDRPRPHVVEAGVGRLANGVVAGRVGEDYLTPDHVLQSIPVRNRGIHDPILYPFCPQRKVRNQLQPRAPGTWAFSAPYNRLI